MSSSTPTASSEQNPFLVRAAPTRMPSPLKTSPLIDGIVVGALSALNSRVVALLSSPDCSWLVAVSACGDVQAYDCIGLLDEAFAATFVLHLQCEVHSASAVLLSNVYPHVGCVVVGGDKGIMHIIAIEVVRPDPTARSRSKISASGNTSRQTEIVSYKLNRIYTMHMECDSGRIMSLCAFAFVQQPSLSSAASCPVACDRTLSTWSLLSYCTDKPYIAHWAMHTVAAPQLISAPKPSRRIDVDRALGGVQSMAVAPCGLWMAAGTSRGFICICDLRFSVLVKTIFTGSDTILSSIVICPAPPVSVDSSDDSSLGRHGKKSWFGSRKPSKSILLSPPGVPMDSGVVGGSALAPDQGPRVWVVTPSGGPEGDAVCAHNVATGCCDAKFEIVRGHMDTGDSRNSSISGVSSSVPVKDANGDEIIAADRYAEKLLLADYESSVLPTIRAISVAANVSNSMGAHAAAGGMFTAGSDRHLRYWSFAHPELCSCALLSPLGSPAQSEIFAHRCENGCALFTARSEDDSGKSETMTAQQRYRRGVDALVQNSVGDLVGVTAMCMIGR
jgi:hypothetical protein